MPWKCPACEQAILHPDAEIHPRPGARYRCHICRLELTLNSATNKLIVAPVDVAPDTPPRRRRRSSE